MSVKTSPITHVKYGVELVCKTWGFPRSSFYHIARMQQQSTSKKRRGRAPIIPDDKLLFDIKEDLEKSPFKGEGHRKVHARLRRKNIPLGRNRVLRIMREHKLLSPYRSVKGEKKVHDGRITTDYPNEMWCTDATKVCTVKEGWVWCFSILEHWNAECLGYYVTKRGNRFAAIEALNQAIENVFGSTSEKIARGLKLRLDHGSQFLSKGFINQAKYWGIEISKAFVREPETNGVIERFFRTFKEQVVYGRYYYGLTDFQKAVAEFMRKYNSEWLIGKLGYHSPIEARNLYQKGINVNKKIQAISPALAEQRRGTRLLCFDPSSNPGLNRENNFTVPLCKEEEHGYSVLTDTKIPQFESSRARKKV